MKEGEKKVCMRLYSLCVCCVCVCVCNGGGGELTVSYNWPGKLPGFYIHSTKKEKKKKTKKKKQRTKKRSLQPFFSTPSLSAYVLDGEKEVAVCARS